MNDISLRDYFAIHEKSEVSDYFKEFYADEILGKERSGRRPLSAYEIMEMNAQWRYACADAMLRESEK